MPGNLDEKTVKKYAEFREIGYYSPISFVSQKIIRSFDYYGAMQSSVCNLAAANFIDKQYTVFRKMSHSGRSYSYCDTSDYYQMRMNEKTNWLCEWLGKDGIGRVARASFDENIFINFAGFHNSISKKSFLSICGSTTPTAGITGQDVEINNDVFARQVDLHNAILMFSSNFTCQENGFHNGVCDKSTGALSSKITSQLDAKIDDGRPGTGRLLATKSGFAKRSSATDAEKLSVCYDKNALDVDKAIYHENSNLKYGCNLVRVMEDVK